MEPPESTPVKPGFYTRITDAAAVHEPPVGYVEQLWGTQGVKSMIKADDEWLEADGSVFDPAKYPQLMARLVMYRARPRWSWRHPLTTWRAQRAWDTEDDHSYLPYGGTIEEPRLPDMRVRLITHDMLERCYAPRPWWRRLLARWSR